MNLRQQTTVAIEYYGEHRYIKECEDGFRYEAHEKRLVRTEQFTGTLYDAFCKVEKENERLRYLNGYYIKFADKAVQQAYQAWSRGLTQSQWYDIVGMTCANTD
ncbi:MAG: hypothetical protein LIO91_03695 [Bacteroidales bacterium]|nr:hypothetical protein [Bacteroidales bacterium]